MLNCNEPVTHLFFDKGADGYHRYEVTVPVRIAEEIGFRSERWPENADGIDTLRQFLDAIETRGECAEFEVFRVDGAELRAWTDCRERLNAKAL
jgi:hypothetical protein